jgi:DNA-binding LacI/PurR family transcriptional regulator
MPKEINKRPTIGFFVSELEGDYTEALCGGMIDAAEDYDVNLIILPGKTIKLSYAGQYNFNVIYEYVNPKNVDAIIMASSVLSGFIKKSQFDAFCSRYKPLPIVSIGIPVDGISCVLTKNQTGFMQILNHLINDHGKQRIAFIKGPDEHVEAVERFLVYR